MDFIIFLGFDRMMKKCKWYSRIEPGGWKGGVKNMWAWWHQEMKCIAIILTRDQELYYKSNFWLDVKIYVRLLM